MPPAVTASISVAVERGTISKWKTGRLGMGQERPICDGRAMFALPRRIQRVDATPLASNLERWNGMHMEGHARTWFTRKQKAELWERRKSGQWVTYGARALEERERCLRSWVLNGGIASAPRRIASANSVASTG